MFSFNNNHIFTGYLKQLLATVNLPTYKVYTNEFARHLAQTGKEDPRVVESFGSLGINRPIANINYLKNNEICSLQYDFKNNKTSWKSHSLFYYDKDKHVPGATRRLKSLGPSYDTKTHEYLGDFLRFLRDYYNVNLMSLYNCFNNKICSNIDFKLKLNRESEENSKTVVFDSSDPKFHIYAFPVKLFSDYTIAIDCCYGIELFCGIYKTTLEGSSRCIDLFNRTYQKIDKTMFNQPFVYDKLNVKYWTAEKELSKIIKSEGRDPILVLEDPDSISRYDLINREQDLKLFIKVPTTCKSSITILEGDFSTYNDLTYLPNKEQSNNELEGTVCINPKNNEWLYKPYSANQNINKITRWKYVANRSIVNFDNKVDLNSTNFRPISKLQLLALNTGESYPFADRLIEYLSGSAITPVDGIADNIKRVQEVMSQNNHYFKINGIWENKIQKIAYDYMANAGPIRYDPEKNKLIDKRLGMHPNVGYNSKSALYDTLGYIDKDIEKYYVSWKSSNNAATVDNSIQNVDIYNELYDI